MNKILLIFLVIFSQPAISQITIKTGIESFKTNTDNLEYCGTDKSEIYYIKQKYHLLAKYQYVDFSIIKVDSNMNFLSETPINSTHKNKKLFIRKIIAKDRTLYIFATFFNEKHKKEYLFVRKIDFSGKIISDWKFLIETNRDELFTKLNRHLINPYMFTISPDSSMFAIYSQENYLKKQKFTFFSVYIFDFNTLNPILETRKKMKERLLNGLNSNILLNNKGEYFITFSTSSKIDRLNFYTYYRRNFFLFTGKINQDSAKLIPITLGQKVITGIVSSQNKKGDLYIGAYYSLIDFLTMKGSVVFKLENDKLRKIFCKEFDESFLMNNRLANTKKRYQNESIRYQPNTLYINSKEEFLMIGERMYEMGYRYHNPNAMFYDTPETALYHFSNLLIEKGDSKGNVKRTIVNDKTEKNVISATTSYSTYLTNNRLYVIYNIYKVSVFGTSKGKSIIKTYDLNLKLTDKTVFDKLIFVNPLLYYPLKTNRTFHTAFYQPEGEILFTKFIMQ
jgi:hypothetical protein